jgi:hypothetical protein
MISNPTCHCTVLIFLEPTAVLDWSHPLFSFHSFSFFSPWIELRASCLLGCPRPISLVSGHSLGDFKLKASNVNYVLMLPKTVTLSVSSEMPVLSSYSLTFSYSYLKRSTNTVCVQNIFWVTNYTFFSFYHIQSIGKPKSIYLHNVSKSTHFYCQHHHYHVIAIHHQLYQMLL